MNDISGTVFYTALVFIVGALIGSPMFSWLKAKMPWGK